MMFRRLAIATVAALGMAGLIPAAQAQTGDPSFNQVVEGPSGVTLPGLVEDLIAKYVK